MTSIGSPIKSILNMPHFNRAVLPSADSLRLMNLMLNIFNATGIAHIVTSSMNIITLYITSAFTVNMPGTSKFDSNTIATSTDNRMNANASAISTL
ncbi:hypothetical protein [Prevotella sp.]|uniref:hypothetical protein n=1 Tax=Prevotella sp. TaxID=59823 RepID=UPI003F80583A